MWIKKQMIILPSKNGNSKIGLNPNALFNKPHLYYFSRGAVYHECQNLYITSDEEIKGGDWIYRYEDKKVFQSKSYFSKGNPIKKGLITKIIATTDKSITINDYDSSDEDAVVNCYLPQIPHQFIEKWIEEYNKSNVITEVMVEYTNQYLSPNYNSVIKVNPDNTINIKLIKENWTKDEVVELLIHAISNCNCSDGELYNKEPHEVAIWIEENL